MKKRIFYASTSKEMGFTDIYDADFGTIEERLKEVKNPLCMQVSQNYLHLLI